MARTMTGSGTKAKKAKVPAKRPGKTTSSPSSDRHPGAAPEEVRLDNQKDRDALIRKTAAELSKLEDEREAVALRIKALKNINVKGRLGMKIKDFNVAVALHEMERPDRTGLLSTIQDVARALKTGETVNFLDIIEKDQEVLERIEETRLAISDPYEAGRLIGLDGLSRAENPYPDAKSPNSKRWNDGHHDGLMEKLQSIGPGTAPAN